jgi:hypothetical protein
VVTFASKVADSKLVCYDCLLGRAVYLDRYLSKTRSSNYEEMRRRSVGSCSSRS